MGSDQEMHVVVMTGAGISAESGLKTFRDSDGLWEGYRVEEVATPEAWEIDPEKVLQFYNERRRAVLAATPNPAHQALVQLEENFRVSIVTQNVDDLHERAGSTSVLHLHGEIRKSQSSYDSKLVYDIRGSELNLGDCCERGAQLRPAIVWFGEAVPMMEEAIEIAKSADIFVVVGTSLAVYPAAGLINFVSSRVPCSLIDPKASEIFTARSVRIIEQSASVGLPLLVDELLQGLYP